MKQARIAILASGAGTTAEAFIAECAEGTVAGEVALVICNVPDAGVFQRVDNLNHTFNLSIATKVVNKKTCPPAPNEQVGPGQQTVSEQQTILKLLHEYDIDIVVLLGYMKLVGPMVVSEYGWKSEYTSPYQARMLNTHPGLLPETKGYHGIHVQEHVLANRLPQGGQTLHVVSEAYDDGPVIAENRVDVMPDDTPDSLFDRVRETEKAHIGSDINHFIIERNDYYQQKET